MKILTPLRRFFTTIKPIVPGAYHYQAPDDDPRNYRMHLRIENDGSGILILNASTILHLNQTAAEYAYYLIHNYPADEVGRIFAARYNVKQDTAQEDYLSLSDRLQTLIDSPDLDPVTFLDFDRQMPFTGQISAPFRLDCALTYGLPSDAKPEAAPLERVKRELNAQEWRTIIDKAWDVGIPHIIFTGGEPTLRDDLPDLITHTEKNGQVAGLLTDGHRIADKAYLDTLLQTGLDHLTIVFNSNEPLVMKAVENALVEDLFVAVHLTIDADNQGQVMDLIHKLAEMGVKSVSLSINDPQLSTVLESARDLVASLQLDLVWNIPVPYSALNPIAHELGHGSELEGAGRAWLYVEPDGDVLPSQGINQVLGNMLSDPWNVIWKGGKTSS